jgi:glycosyltransferase involved in cell wall biosynthesis
MPPKLSVLICSLTKRSDQLKHLMNKLSSQISNDMYINNTVELLVNIDNGSLSTGLKRNELLGYAKGDYIAFFDDDDEPFDGYIPKIIDAVESGPDCCGMEGIITFSKSGISRMFIHSIKYKTWFEENGVYYRNPNHLSPVKRELALQAKFPDKTVGEDYDYSMRLLPLLKTEVYIKEPISHYITK